MLVISKSIDLVYSYGSWNFQNGFDSIIILQIRLMKDREIGENKGYALVAFKTNDVAQKAIEELHSKEFKVIMLPC